MMRHVDAVKTNWPARLGGMLGFSVVIIHYLHSLSHLVNRNMKEEINLTKDHPTILLIQDCQTIGEQFHDK